MCGVVPAEPSANGRRRMDVSRSSSVEFYDSEGTLWIVRERDAGRVPGAQGKRCLIFSSDTTIRRVWNYPSDWRDLPASVLRDLSWAR